MKYVIDQIAYVCECVCVFLVWGFRSRVCKNQIMIVQVHADKSSSSIMSNLKLKLLNSSNKAQEILMSVRGQRRSDNLNEMREETLNGY